MNTSPKTSGPSKPIVGTKVPLGNLSYFRARNKYRVFNLVIKEFKKSGITQADLARRLAMDAGQLSRYLSAPGNWTLDRLSDFLFAISGAEANYRIGYPLEQPLRNYAEPSWLPETIAAAKSNNSVDLHSIFLDGEQTTKTDNGGLVPSVDWALT